MTVHVPRSDCPECGYKLDAATDLDGDASPTPGDFSICFNCASILVFDNTLHLAAPTHEQLREAPDEMWRVQQRVKQVAKVTPRYERLPCGCMAGTESVGDQKAFVFIPHALDCQWLAHVKEEIAKTGKPMVVLDAR